VQDYKASKALQGLCLIFNIREEKRNEWRLCREGALKVRKKESNTTCSGGTLFLLGDD
jgi:hypothetical protein